MTSGLPESRGITFQWEILRRFPTVLPAFIALSVIGHGVAFFLFRVVYPPQATMAAPPPAITVLDPTRPDHLALLQWIEAEDPAPAAVGTTGITDQLLQLPYRPSFAQLKTPPLVASETIPRVQYPPAHDPLAVIRSGETRIEHHSQTPAGATTRVRFSAALAGRTPATSEFIWPNDKRTSQLVEPATFLLGVNDRGLVQYVIPQRTSGDSALDSEAAALLATLKLSPAESPIIWGHATFVWGREVFAEAPPKP